MEIAGFLAANVVAVLAPALGRLLRKTTDKVTERASDQLSEQALRQASELWSIVRPRVEGNASARRAVERLAQQPQNEDYQAALRVELDELLTQDRQFRQLVERKLDSMGITHVEQHGDRSVMVGRDNSGTIVYTGSYHSYTGEHSKLDDFRSSPGAAKFLIVLGMVVFFVGFALFLVPIAQAFLDTTQPGEPGFAEGPDMMPAVIGGGLAFAGIVLGGLGSLIAGLSRPRNRS